MVSYHVLYKKIFQFINFLLFEASGTKELFTYSMYVVARKVKQGLETDNNILTPCYNYVQVETISKTWTFVHLWKVSKPQIATIKLIWSSECSQDDWNTKDTVCMNVYGNGLTTVVYAFFIWTKMEQKTWQIYLHRLQYFMSKTARFRF